MLIAFLLLLLIVVSVLLFIYMIQLLFIPIVIGIIILMIRNAAKKREPGVSMYIRGVENSEARTVLTKGFEKQQTLKKLKIKVSKREIREKVNSIIDVVDRIFECIKNDPTDIKAARQFLNYYLDSTITILNKYIELSKHSTASSEIEETLKKTEELLDTIHHSFEVQLGKLLSNDVMDLDTEITLLEKTFRMEGLNYKRS
ncbi:MAG: 5-bromo-4-chloroindolyl phosphate hydrolysis family protein [Spirochaetes bacterium]|nr:5-bromo-4-chloroindolyl phosphate hydrolysis family protein [Spirochaetota bacterium]